MKTTWTHVTVAVVAAGLFVAAGAVAQDVPQLQPPAPPSADTTYAPPMASTYAPTQNRAAPPQNGVVGRPATNGKAIQPGTTVPQANDEGSPLDSGLWEGAPAGPCCAICGGGSGCPPDWYTEIGARVLSRTRPREVLIGYQYYYDPSSGTTTLTETLTSRTIGPDISTAGMMTIGHYFARDIFNRDHFVELTFWGLNAWKDRAEVYGDGNLYSQFAINDYFLDGFDGASYQSIHYESYNNNYELNGRIVPRGREDQLVLHPNGRWRRECQPGMYMSYLYGLRFMQINENFGLHSEAMVDSSSGGQTTSTLFTGDYDTVTRNNLFGLQIGTEMTFRNCRWSWGIRAKVGPYVNASDQSSIIEAKSAEINEFSRQLAASKIEAAFIGETGFFATYKFRPNLMGRIGYDIMWVTGLALAPEQLEFTTNTRNDINTNGTIVYNGLSLGLEWMW